VPRYAALLRGIAPSGPNMTNDTLRGVFEGLGYEHVASVLASGNIVFDSEESDVPALEHRIEGALTSQLGIRSRTIIRSHAELRALVDSDPFPDLTHGPGTYLTATFLKYPHPGAVLPRPPDPSIRIVGYDRSARVVLAITDSTVPGQAPTFMTWLERTCGKDITTRSWLTVQRVVRKLQG
jgi:uncharacterized protein (DUF1697 family)